MDVFSPLAAPPRSCSPHTPTPHHHIHDKNKIQSLINAATTKASSIISGSWPFGTSHPLNNLCVLHGGMRWGLSAHTTPPPVPHPLTRAGGIPTPVHPSCMQTLTSPSRSLASLPPNYTTQVPAWVVGQVSFLFACGLAFLASLLFCSPRIFQREGWVHPSLFPPLCPSPHSHSHGHSQSHTGSFTTTAPTRYAGPWGGTRGQAAGNPGLCLLTPRFLTLLNHPTKTVALTPPAQKNRTSSKSGTCCTATAPSTSPPSPLRTRPSVIRDRC
jgi:hypothetical protein